MSQSYERSVFLCTHNSYSGGDRGSVPQQLEEGCRLVELDIHGDSYAKNGDFGVGHLYPGNSVSHSGGNPASNNLADWLGVIAGWSVANPGHAPITLVLDLKNNISKAGPGQGGFDDLESELAQAFGSALYTAAEWSGAWPDVETMRDRVLVVMSGDQSSRKAYFQSSRRMLWVEYQKGNDGALAPCLFYATSNSNMSWAHDAVAQGRVVRVWKFSERDQSPPPVNFPATDDPTADWYVSYGEAVGAVR